MVERITKVTLTAQVNQYLAEFEKARKATEKTGDSAEEAAAKFEQQNRAMSQIGSGLLVAGGVAAAATALSIKAAIDWESAWAGVTKTVDGSAAEMSVLEDQLRGLTSVLPATHEEIAGVAEAAGQLGVAREDVSSFTKTMIDLSETTNLTADEAATSIAQLMNVMQTAPDDVDNLGAALVALGNDGASTERDIVQMAQRIAGAGKVVGLTEPEVLGFANALASVGIEAEAGGTAISKIMTDIAMSVSAGGEDLERFAAVAGQSSAEFSKSFKDDPADAIATFIEGLGRINTQGGDVFKTLSDLGQSDVRVSQALLGMANSGDLLRKSLQLGASAWEDNLALQVEAAKRYETTEAKLQIAANGMRDAAIDIGSVFLPAVSAAAEVVADLSFGFSGLPEPLQAVGIGLGVVATSAALASGAFLVGVPKIAEFNAALAVLRTSQIPGVAKAADLASSAITRTGTAMGGVARFMTGPWGIALGVAAAAAFAWVAANEKMRSEAASFRDTLDETTGALTENTREMIAKKLVDAGVFDQIEKIGVSQAELVDAIYKGGSAYDDLLKRMRAAHDESNGFDAGLGNSINTVREMGVQLGIAKEGHDDYAAATKDGAEATETAAEAYQSAAAEAKSLVDEVLSLIDTMNAQNDVASAAIQANARYQEGLAGIATDVQRQKDAYEDAHGTLDGFVLSLDQATASGAANAASLDSVASSARDASKAQYEQDLTTMSAKDATDKYVGALAAQRQAFIDSATQAGYNRDEVVKLADQIFKTPGEKEIKFLIDTATAQQKVSDFIAFNNGKRINILADIKPGTNSVGPVAGGYQFPGSASGGIIPGAPSDVDNRIYALATGEFVVRSRQVSIPANRAALEYINAGGVIRGYAGGGYVQPQYSSSSMRPSVNVAAPSLDGLAIVGQLDLGDGLVGMIDGRITASNRSKAVKLQNGKRY